MLKYLEINYPNFIMNLLESSEPFIDFSIINSSKLFEN